ncbi:MULTISPECIES: hypothetical protein [Flammeovirga]|uniref:Uncharacterized protein n=1 Tax=Flammeovirga agarivorans TaxID=2726742 RepID=A0A7X8SJ63_9BACT|nr:MULTISPECIES: hypothetical protein [Flammeovirga]NLR91102.1 hypothetical protein [Flammeovirga agarivorans]
MSIFIVLFSFAIAIGLGSYLSINAKKNKLNSPDHTSTPELNDANVISLASQYEDGISVAALCLKTKSSAKAAKKKLEELRSEGILHLSIGENGTEKYMISDTSLLDKK